MQRRDFLSGVIATSALLGGPKALLAGQSGAAGSGLKILVLGGTGFIGPPTVQYALERGHSVTIFTRGRSKSEFPGVEHLVGDRNDDLSALEGRQWDVVLDNNARDYRWVQKSTRALKDSVQHYVFISSISVYAGEISWYMYLDEPYDGSPIDINSPLAQPPDDFEMGQELDYGSTKALSEKIIEDAFPGRSTIVRPGFIVGPGDPSDRFTYWPARIARGGEVLVPGDGNDQVQIIDVRDLMQFTVQLAENSTYGIFNGVGPASKLTMAEMVYGVRAVTNSAVKFTWVPSRFLRDNEVQPYTDMPIWVPGEPRSAVDNSHAIAAGLTFRPLAEIASDTLAWHENRPTEEQDNLKIGISREREAEVLAAWHASRGS
ncbi:MAG TPA: NAD-dependent epimerase/dehydratase family protein [Xanthomonadales bacterium]|nr:NAD-dependent epimerase/dehydratase family protein [Xanthomonadales bacterium]